MRMKTSRKEPGPPITDAKVRVMNWIVLLSASAEGTLVFFVVGEPMALLFAGKSIALYVVFLLVLPPAGSQIHPGRMRIERKGAWQIAVVGYGGVLLTMVLRTLYMALGG